ncbi:unnamed protein product [Tilletia caries]|nr:unnamed protein product [Tilletia caries]
MRSTDDSVRILVATEAAGMGVDVSDVDLIIQYRLPRTLTEFVQHAGRAMRNQDQRGVAVLLVEPWVWQPDELKPVSQTVKARQAAISAPLRRFLSGKECRRLIIKEEMALDFEWIRKQTVTFEEMSLPLGASSASPSSTISATSPSPSVSATRPRRPHAKPRCLWNEDPGLGPSVPPSCCDVCDSKSPVIIHTLEEASSSSTQNRSIKGYRIPRAHPSLSRLRQDFITHLLEWRQSYFDQRRKIEAFLPSPEIVLSNLSLVRVATMAGRMVKLAETNVRFETEPMRQLIGEEAETLSDQLIGTLVVSCDVWARKSTSQSFAGHLTKGGDWKEPPKG